MNTALFTIDTDNAVIRFYPARARKAGISDAAEKQLVRDLDTMAAGISYVTNVRYRVEFTK